ncbi:tetratricopeptide repeat protein [Roseibium litorale]|nr:tetratricopeptide repeat protein [Roseibium litorale]
MLTFKDRTLLPHYDAVVTGGVLRISFEEPVDVNVDDVPLELADYISIARRDPDGSAIRFALKSQFQINTLEAGEKLFIDILPSNWQGLPPGLPDDVVRELAKRAEEAMRKVRALEQARLKAQEGPTVELHIGEHPTFTRLVFDWSIRFDTAFVREDDLIKVTFNHPAQLDISKLRAHLPPGVIDATSFLDQGKLKFLMRVDPTVDIRAFREDDTYVIDITPESMTPIDAANAKINEEMSVTINPGHQGLVVAPGQRVDGPAPDAAPPQPAATPASMPLADPLAPSSAASVPLEAVSEPENPAPERLAFALSLPEDASAAPAVPPAAQMPAENVNAAPAEVDNSLGSVQEVPGLPRDVPRPKPVAGAAPEPAGELTADAEPSAPEEPAILQADAAPPAEEPARSAEAIIPPATALEMQADSSPSKPDVMPAPEVTAEAAPPVSGGVDLTSTIPPKQLPADIMPPSVAEGTQRETAAVSDLPEVPSAQADDIPPPLPLETSSQDGQDAWRASSNLPMELAQRSPEQPPADFGKEIRNIVSAEARRIGNTVRVEFPFVEPVSSAIFRRNNSVWMIFDTDATIDTRGIASALAESAKAISSEAKDGYQVLRIDLSDPVLATVGLDGNAWSLVIGDMVLEPSKPLRLERNVRGDGGSVLRVLYKDPQKIREIQDPFVGDTIAIVTGFGPPRGLLKAQNFVDLEALSSAQGFAMAVKSDGVTMKILGDDVIIEKTDGLSLSNRHLNGGTGALNSISDPNQPDFIDFVNMSTEDPKTYQETLQRLESDLTNATAGQRNNALMEMAKFYLAHQFAQEALGLMKLAIEENPAIAEDSAYNLMMGAAQTLASRPKEAFPFLNRPELKSSPDAAIWQTIVEVQMGNWTAARIAMPRGRAVVGNYPRAIQTEFNLAAAQAMVEANDFGVANGILAEIEPSDISTSQAARYDILRGRIADASGRSEEALKAFDLVAKSSDRPRAAEAEYRALRIRYRDGELPVSDTIDQLAGLATSWRGDEIELKTLRFLAQLQAETGNYRLAFEAMKSAVQADPNADTTRLLQEEMNSLFTSLFLDGKADQMPPIQALSLFYDFRELTPIGRQGDEMVRGLAKRLVEVELLDQATELLRHQVDNRLKGAARAQVAADLAAVYLIDRKPEEALRVLNVTRQASLPSTLERQRNIVEARALTASGRPDLALELVRNMRGTDVDRLRADTFWSAQSWREAGEQLEAMHGSRWSDNIPLDTREQQDILKAGIAYSLAGDQLSLNRLQTKYAAKMADSPNSAAFEVVTRPIEVQGVEFLQVANQLANINEMDTFMEEYRRQYMTPDKSAESGSVMNATPPAGQPSTSNG